MVNSDDLDEGFAELCFRLENIERLAQAVGEVNASILLPPAVLPSTFPFPFRSPGDGLARFWSSLRAPRQQSPAE